jgi:uracil phosphoribosyltransferase
MIPHATIAKIGIRRQQQTTALEIWITPAPSKLQASQLLVCTSSTKGGQFSD